MRCPAMPAHGRRERGAISGDAIVRGQNRAGGRAWVWRLRSGGGGGWWDSHSSRIFHLHFSGTPAAILARLDRAIAAHRPACVLLGNPNNPTGHGIPARELGALIRAHDCAWIVDEAFSEFAGVDPPHSLLPHLAEWPRLLIARSLTKSFAVPGLRIGFLATTSRAWLEAWRICNRPGA